MTTYLTTDLTELREYATFEQQSEMDESIYENIAILRSNEVPVSVIEVLRFFGRSSLRVLGVSFAKYDTIAKSTGYSRRTVIRAVNTLEVYGFIERLPTLKKWSSYGSSRKRSVNVIRLLAAPHDDTTGRAEEVNGDKGYGAGDSPEPMLHKHITNTRSRYDGSDKRRATALDMAGKDNGLIQPIYNVLKPFFNLRDLYEITGVILRAKATVHRGIRLEDHVQDVKTVLLDVVRRYKTGSIKRLDSYLYTAMCRLFKRLLYVEVADEVYG